MTLLHQHASARILGFLRIWVFGLWFADVLKDPLSRLAEIPLDELRPVGILQCLPDRLWPVILSADYLFAFWVVLLAVLIVAQLGTRHHHLVAALACAGLTLYQSLVLSVASFSHAELASLYVTYVLALFPSADGLSVRRRPSRLGSPAVYQAAMITATAVFLSTYMLIGIRRLFVGGLDILSNGTILRLIANRSARPNYFENSLGLWVLGSPALSTALEIGFVVVTIFEALSLVCLVSKWFRRCWLGVMLSFHILSWPLMQILFLHNLLLIVVLIVDLEKLVGSRTAAIVERTARAESPS